MPGDIGREPGSDENTRRHQRICLPWPLLFEFETNAILKEMLIYSLNKQIKKRVRRYGECIEAKNKGQSDVAGVPDRFRQKVSLANPTGML